MIGERGLNYKIRENLGECGTGLVYKPHYTILWRNVNLKFLPHYLSIRPYEMLYIKIGIFK